MAAQQVFIALQCYHCSTMQVKQQKRSSNKWVCAVCNQRQSVRKVFAQSCLARDIRGFVQRFNMSRMTAGGWDGDLLSEIGDDVKASPSLGSSLKDEGWCTPKRTDWSEYLDQDGGESTADASNEENSDYLQVVTEIPTEIIRRQFQERKSTTKPRNTGSKCAFRPSLPKRKQTQSPQLSHLKDKSDDWTKRPRVSSSGPSKWTEYLRQDTSENDEGTNSPEPYTRGGADVGRGQPHDAGFDEEVHPDFL